MHGGVDTRDAAWHRFLKFEIGRARALYREGARGIALLAPDARRCTWLCAAGYAAILGAIEKNGFDTLTVRAQVSGWERARIMLGTWRSAADVVAVSPGGAPVTG
jgi:phytoene synthase